MFEFYWFGVEHGANLDFFSRRKKTIFRALWAWSMSWFIGFDSQPFSTSTDVDRSTKWTGNKQMANPSAFAPRTWAFYEWLPFQDSTSDHPNYPSCHLYGNGAFHKCGYTLQALLDGAKFMENPKIWMIWELPAASQTCHRGCRQGRTMGWNNLRKLGYGGPKRSYGFHYHHYHPQKFCFRSHEMSHDIPFFSPSTVENPCKSRIFSGFHCSATKIFSGDAGAGWSCLWSLCHDGWAARQ